MRWWLLLALLFACEARAAAVVDTLRWTYPDHRASVTEGCYVNGDTLHSLDSVRVVRQLVGDPRQVVLWAASARGLEGMPGSLVVAADTAATAWIWCKAVRSPWSCESNPVGVGAFPASVPPAVLRPRRLVWVDVAGRRVEWPTQVPGIYLCSDGRRVVVLR